MNGAVATVDTGILERAGVKVTPTSLTLTNKSLPYAQMEELFGFVHVTEKACYWWMADILNASEELYGEVFAQLEAVTGLAPQTLTNRASVGRRIAPKRRRANVLPSVHEVVAYLEPAEQDRWLGEAERQRWSRSQLREAITGPRVVRDGLRAVVESMVRSAMKTGDGDHYLVPAVEFEILCETIGFGE